MSSLYRPIRFNNFLHARAKNVRQTGLKFSVMILSIFKLGVYLKLFENVKIGFFAYLVYLYGLNYYWAKKFLKIPIPCTVW